MFDVTVTATAVPSAFSVIVSEETDNVGSPAACEMVAVAVCPPAAVIVIFRVLFAIVVFFGIASVMENSNSALAPGSPAMAVLFVVVAPPAE